MNPTPPKSIATFTDQQLAALDVAHDRWLCVQAGAGAGKTAVLSNRFVRLLEEGVPLESIVAMTFTRKAAGEMAGRVLLLLSERIEELELDKSVEARAVCARLQRARDYFHAHRIGTIDSFCRAQLASHSLEAGLEPGFNVLDEDESAEALTQALRQFDLRMAELIRRTENSEEIEPGDLQLLDAYRALAAISTSRGLSQILRWALKERFALQKTLGAWNNFVNDTDHQRYLESARDTSERFLKEEFQRQGFVEQIGELADIARELKALGDKGKKTDFVLEVEHCIKQEDFERLASLNAKGGDTKAWKATGRSTSEATSVRNAVLKLYRSLQVDESIEVLGLTGLQALAQVLPALIDAYRTECRGNLDFTALKHRLDALISDDEMRDSVARSIRYLMIDEFQDTDPVQWRIFERLCVSGRVNLFVVGDAKQSIYRFRGADVSIFRRAKAAIIEHNVRVGAVRSLTHPYDTQKQLGRSESGIGAHLGEEASRGSIKLTANFRSRSAPLDLGNRLFDDLLAGRMLGDSDTATKAYADFEAEPEAMDLTQRGAEGEQNPHGQVEILPLAPAPERSKENPKIGDEVVADRAEDERESLKFKPKDIEHEAHEIVRHIKETLIEDEGMNPSDIALLVPQHKVVDSLQRAFASYQLPYSLADSGNLFRRPEAHHLWALVAALAEPLEDLSLVALLRSPFIGLSDAGLLQLRKAAGNDLLYQTWAAVEERLPGGMSEEDGLTLRRGWQRFERWCRRAWSDSLAELIEDAYRESGLHAAFTGQDRAQRRGNLLQLLDLVRDWQEVKGPNPAALAEWLREQLEKGTKYPEGEVLGNVGGVQVMTIHKSKGKEFEAVVLGFLNSGGVSDTNVCRLTGPVAEGAQPLVSLRPEVPRYIKPVTTEPFFSRIAKRMDKPKEVAELRRLFYVAWTRARRRLIVTYQAKNAKSNDKASALTPEADSVSNMQQVLGAALGTTSNAAIVVDELRDACQRWLKLRNAKYDAKLPANVLIVHDARVIESQLVAIETQEKRTNSPIEICLQEGKAKLAHSQAEVDRVLAARPLTEDSQSDTEESAEIQDAFSIEGVGQKERYGLSAAAFGEAVHSTIEFTLSGEREVGVLAGRRVRERFGEQVSDEARQEIATQAGGALARLREFGDPIQEYAELEIGLLEAGRIASRRIDYCAEFEPGHWVIVDYKTGRRRESYEEQLRTYAYCLKQRLAAAGARVERVTLYLLMTGSGELEKVGELSDTEICEPLLK